MNTKKNLLMYFFILFILQLSNAQTNLLTEDFETNGEGTRYTTNTFFASCNDLFERSTNGGVYCMTNEPTNTSGTFYWSGEDCDAASGGTGILTLNPVVVTGHNLEMKVMLAVERPNDFRFETNDELLFQYNMDGGGWNNFAAFYGSFEGSGLGNGDLTQDADFNGMGDLGGLEIESSDFADLTFSIPVTGNSLQVRFIMGQNAGTEGIMLDNIRINTAPVLHVDLTAFSVEKMEEEKVIINWRTAAEKNNAYFSIQRSNNSHSWEEIKKINGAGQSTEVINYSIVDEEPLGGLSYYRLKQIDFDGNFDFSNIKSVNLENSNAVYSIYPNPTFSNKISIEVPNDKTAICIFDSSGNVIYKNVVDKGLHEILLQKFYSGIYFVKFIHAEKIEVHKLILRGKP